MEQETLHRNLGLWDSEVRGCTIKLMDVRPYLPTDREACLAIFDSNSLAPYLRFQFESFLDDLAAPYFVLEQEGALLACGGFQIEEENARLVWGMVRSDSQKQGLGRFLLMYRLREIGKYNGLVRVHLATSPQAAGFYQSQGFKALTMSTDRVVLMKKLTVCP